VHEAYQAETETEASRLETEAFVNWSTGPRQDRDRGIQVRGETETEAFKSEARPRRIQQKHKISLVPAKDYKT